MRAHGNEGRLGRRFAIVIGVAAAGVVALGAQMTTAATGNTYRLVGTFDRAHSTTDPRDSRVLMRVKLDDKGEPKFVKSFKFGGVVACPSSPEPDRSGEIPEKIRVDTSRKPPRYHTTFSEQVADDSVDISISGKLRKKGRLSTGKVRFSDEAPCLAGPATFTAATHCQNEGLCQPPRSPGRSRSASR
jgi:hypothetical protein